MSALLEPLTATGFDAAALEAVVAAAADRDWKTASAVLMDCPAATTAQRELQGRALAVLAAARTPDYRERWDAQVGEFVRALNIADDNGGGAEALLGDAYWPEGYAAVALRLATGNLHDIAAKGHKLASGYIAEMCSMGWRNTHLSQLRRVAQSDGAGLLTHAADTNDDTRHAFKHLLSRDPGLRCASELSWELWYGLWETYRQSQTKGTVVSLPVELLHRVAALDCASG